MSATHGCQGALRASLLAVALAGCASPVTERGDAPPKPDSVIPVSGPPRMLLLDDGSGRRLESSAPRGVVLGPGDVLTVTVLGQPELTTTVDVGGDGRIKLPLIGPVSVSGESTSGAADRIALALSNGGFLLNPQVSVVTAASRSQQVSVLGEVRQPGRFPVATRLNVLDVLALAGGITENGSGTIHVLRPRGGKMERHELSLDAFLRSGPGFEPFEMRAGDTLIVPKAELFYIYGEVRTPNAYRLRPGMTVMQALSVSGGLTDKGSDRRVEVHRRLESGETREFSAGLNEVLQPGDIVYVKERLF